MPEDSNILDLAEIEVSGRKEGTRRKQRREVNTVAA